MLDLAAQSPQETPRWLYRSAGIATLVLALWAFRGLLGYDPYLQVSRDTSELEDWFFQRSGGSAPLIFGVSSCFVLTRLGRLKQAFDRPGPSGGRGWLLLLPATLIYCWAIYVSAQDLLLIALILTALGAGWWLGGRTARDTLLFPVLFLLLLIPWPAALINQIIFPMQLATAQATTAVLNAFGLSATVSGELIFAPTGVFRVIESCAGLRMVDALIMAACVYSSLFYRSRLQVAILLFCAPVIALIANLGRVLSLVLNPLSTFAEIHAAQGIVVTVLGVLMLAGVDRLLESWLPSPKPDLSDRGATELADLTAAQMPSRWVRTASLSLIFSFLVLASHTIRPWQSQHELWIAPADIPARIEGWRSRTMKLDKELLGSVFVSSWTHREYQRNEETIEFFAASDNRNHRGTNLSSIKTALPQPGLAILNISRTKIAPDLPEVDVYLLGRGDLRFLSYRWSLGLENSFTESLRGALALDRSPWRLPERTLVYRVSSPFDAMAPTGRRQAEQRLRDFMLILWPELRKLEVPMAL